MDEYIVSNNTNTNFPCLVIKTVLDLNLKKMNTSSLSYSLQFLVNVTGFIDYTKYFISVILSKLKILISINKQKL